MKMREENEWYLLSVPQRPQQLLPSEQQLAFPTVLFVLISVRGGCEVGICT